MSKEKSFPGYLWINHPDREAMTRELKARIDQTLPADINGKERAICWVCKYIEFRRYSEKMLLIEGAGQTKADKLMEWKSSFWSEHIRRNSLKSSSELVERAQRAYKELLDAMDSDVGMLYNYEFVGEECVESVDMGAVDALNYLFERIDLRRMYIEKRLDEFGNYPSNRSIYICDLWPALDEDGFSMAAAAGILAEAFERAGLESGDATRRRESIRQTIPNANL